MAEYTNPNHTSGATLTTGELVNSTVANIDKTGENAYAQTLDLSGNATATDLTVTAGGVLNVSSGAEVNGLSIVNSGTKPTVRISKGGIARNVTAGGGTIELFPYGGTLENVTVNNGVYLNVFYNGVVDGGSFSGTRLQVGSKAGQPGGTIRNVTILNAAGDAANQVQQTGSMYDCTIAAGAQYKISGGLAERTKVYGSGARFRVSTGTVRDTIVSGGTLYVSGGTVNGTLISSGGRMYIYGGTLDLVTQRGGGTATTLIYAAGGTINKIVASGGGVTIASNAVVNNLSAYVTTPTGAPKVWVSSGGTVNGGYTSGSFEFRMEAGGGTVNNVTIGKDTYLFFSAGHVSGMTIASNAGMFRFYGSSTDALLIEDTTIYGSVGYNNSANRGLVEGTMSNCRIMSGGIMRQGGGVNKDMTVAGILHLSGGETKDITVSGYKAEIIASGGNISGAVIEDYGKFTVREGATLLDPVIHMNSATAIKVGNNWQYARLNVGSTGIAGGYVSGGTAGAYTSGVFGNTLEIYAWSGGVIEDMTYNWGAYVGVYTGATVSGGAFNRATLSLRGGRAENIVLTSGASVIYNANGGTIDGATVYSGARVAVSSGANVSNVTLLSGGSLYVYGNGGKAVGISADQEAYVRLNFAVTDPERTEAYFDTIADIPAIDVRSAAAGVTYTIADTGNAALAMTVDHLGFTVDLVNGGTTINPFGQKYTVAADATTLAVEEYTVTAENEAKTLVESGESINSGDRALAWNGVNLSSGVAVTLADNTIAGNGWLEFDGVALDSASVVYGAAGTFTGAMNYLAQSGSVIGNFAAGAAANGTVGSVKLIAFDAEFAGLTYAGGFGNVGKTENNEFVAGTIDTVLSSGAAISKDFYAGALANYAKTGTATKVGDITARIAMSVTDEVTSVTTFGKIKGNVYGASAVKAGTISTSPSTPLHTVGNVNLTLAAGDLTDTKCVFAGGYATGSDADKTAPVYTVESVTATVSGGEWGLAHGGRGIFGGAFAGDNLGNNGVYAQVGDVNLTISGGTMGNVYGGGWAQKNAKSEVGNVNITVSGGTVTNVFGGGSHSTSGGTTTAENVTITVSGGTISNAIYARGQSDGDSVTGTAKVIFTGSTDQNLATGVYGYTYVAGGGNATLSFSTYTGTLSGKIGGFDRITLDGNTKMTLDAAWDDVDNAKWTFDATERNAALAGTAFLNWSNADFTGDTITLNLAGGDAVAWNLISTDVGTAVYNKFDVQVDGVSILSETIDIDDKIEGTGTAYDGWGFIDDNGMLKFKQLA